MNELLPRDRMNCGMAAIVCSSFQFALLGIVSAILFIVTVARIFLGEPLLPTAIPLPELWLSVERRSGLRRADQSHSKR
jgi:hypothetical protein